MADLSVTAASVAAGPNAKIRQLTAGTTITAGQWVYEDPTDNNRAKLADADAAGSASVPVGCALNGAAAGQPLFVDTDDDDFTPGGTLSLSAAADTGVYVLSGTAGAACPFDDLAAGDMPVILMVAKSTTKAVLKIVRAGTVLAS